MEIMTILENKEPNKIYGLMGNIDITSNNVNVAVIKGTIFKDTVEEYLKSPKSLNALKLVMLNEELLKKEGTSLSRHELKAVSLAKALIENKEILVLDYFEKELNYHEKENYNRLFKKLANEASKTIVMYSNDISSLWNIVDYIIYVDNSNVINTFSKKDFFKLLKFVDQPIISKIISSIRAKNIKIDDYKDVKDLLKAIYRLKERDQNALSNKY